MTAQRSYHTIEAKPTRYAGCLFRSRIEARWAMVFNEIGIDWEYERYVFDTPNGGYCPDFWLPDHQKWWEVKGIQPPDSSVIAGRAVVNCTNCPLMIVWGCLSYDVFRGIIYPDVPRTVLIEPGNPTLRGDVPIFRYLEVSESLDFDDVVLMVEHCLFEVDPPPPGPWDAL